VNLAVDSEERGRPVEVEGPAANHICGDRTKFADAAVVTVFEIVAAHHKERASGTVVERKLEWICNALLDHAVNRDDRLRQIGEQDRIDDKTVFVIKRN
jgi:hypothetical protein